MSDRPRVLLVAPGRGSYGTTEVGLLSKLASSPAGEVAVSRVVAAVDAARAKLGLRSIREIDEIKPFSDEIHGDAENASALIFAISVVDFLLVKDQVEVAGVCGNSLGFYTALAISDALSLEDAARLVVEMASLQRKHARGGQLLWPVVDDAWRPDPSRQEAVGSALRALEGRAFPSIHLGGFEVLAFEDAAKDELEQALGRARLGGRDFPFALEHHKGYHTPLAEEVALEAGPAFVSLRFRSPRVHLVDGRGAIFTPWSSDPREIAGYTLGHQLQAPFDFTASLRVGLRELGADSIVLLGPGESIGGAIGQALVALRHSGVSDKDSFQKRQREAPLLFALGRPDQRARLIP